jgi:hypothetical protein
MNAAFGLSRDNLHSALQSMARERALVCPTISGSAHPLCEQVPHLLREAHLAIEILRHLVLMSGLKSQCGNPHLAADILAEADDRGSDFLPAVRFAYINFIEQRELAVEFEAEAECEHKVADHSFLHGHEIDAAQAGIKQGLAQSCACDLFIEAHLRHGIELSHELDGSGQIAIGDQLEVGVH